MSYKDKLKVKLEFDKMIDSYVSVNILAGEIPDDKSEGFYTQLCELSEGFKDQFLEEVMSFITEEDFDRLVGLDDKIVDLSAKFLGNVHKIALKTLPKFKEAKEEADNDGSV